MTLFSWYGPWAWPAWPAFAAVDLFLGHSGFADYPFGVKSAIVVALIVLNVSTWAALSYGVMRLSKR